VEGKRKWKGKERGDERERDGKGDGGRDGSVKSSKHRTRDVASPLLFEVVLPPGIG